MKNLLCIDEMIKLGEPSWSHAKELKLIDLAVEYKEAPYMELDGRDLINMCSCSYLGLDTNTEILNGAIEGIKKAKSLHLTTARVRIYTTMLRDLEDALSEHYNCEATSYISCSAATSAFLPILASGALTNNNKPTMIFDRHAHFSMNHVKPICGDQTEVLTCRHNDLEFIEDVCKKYKDVVYVADGTYSISGHAPVKELLALQQKYGLYLYLDDSHGLSITGSKGEGHVRERIPELNDRIVVVGSLAKAFGACGGILMSGDKSLKDLLVRYGNSWSQYVNSAGIGGIMASLKIHQSPLLAKLQKSWRDNLKILDDRFVAQNNGTLSPIRVILLKSSHAAVNYAQEILNKGYYISAVFYPIVSRKASGLRIMPRADVSKEQMQQFCNVIAEVCGEELLNKEK